MKPIIITNNNPKEITIKSIYDEKMDVMRVNVKLKTSQKKGKEKNENNKRKI